jgi:23S rRNA-/tRNA-specific pseudouridylate synthase
MSENKTPIIGDKKYGSKINPIGRLALHASQLKLLDPRNGKELTIKSEV